MKVLKTIDEMKELRPGLAEPVGFVPTMGYLHEGHLALVRQARAENVSVVVSIFVNPTQFGPQEDFARYPRDPQRDLALLDKEGTDIVFMPSADEMYPKDFNSWVEVGKVAERLEGASRPGHFRGVATVVAKLFNIVQPDRAYFGQKDAQQLIVIRKMATDLDMNLEIVAVPTVREPDGLAMSSRNRYLSADERPQAAAIYRVLRELAELLASGVTDYGALEQDGAERLASAGLQPEYVSIRCAADLAVPGVDDRELVILVAARLGKARLIDNFRATLEPH